MRVLLLSALILCLNWATPFPPPRTDPTTLLFPLPTLAPVSIRPRSWKSPRKKKRQKSVSTGATDRAPFDVSRARDPRQLAGVWQSLGPSQGVQLHCPSVSTCPTQANPHPCADGLISLAQALIRLPTSPRGPPSSLRRPKSILVSKRLAAKTSRLAPHLPSLGGRRTGYYAENLIASPPSNNLAPRVCRSFASRRALSTPVDCAPSPILAHHQSSSHLDNALTTRRVSRPPHDPPVPRFSHSPRLLSDRILRPQRANATTILFRPMLRARRS